MPHARHPLAVLVGEHKLALSFKDSELTGWTLPLTDELRGEDVVRSQLEARQKTRNLTLFFSRAPLNRLVRADTC